MNTDGWVDKNETQCWRECMFLSWTTNFLFFIFLENLGELSLWIPTLWVAHLIQDRTISPGNSACFRTSCSDYENRDLCFYEHWVYYVKAYYQCEIISIFTTWQLLHITLLCEFYWFLCFMCALYSQVIFY